MYFSESMGRKLFIVVNVLLLTLITFLCIVPFIHLLAVSLSSNIAAQAGEVKLLPVGFTLEAYKFLAKRSAFVIALTVSLKRVLLGTAISMFLIIITAYPLSKDKKQLMWRISYVWFFVFTMFFSGGLIPSFIIVKNTGLIDSIWALVLPGALNVWNMVMLLNFFRGVPKEMEEAAIIDGANHWTILWRLYIPVSKPAIATILLFTIVNHWNAWFDGILYMNTPTKYPLQTYLSTLIMQINRQVFSIEDLNRLKDVSDKTLRTAQIFLAAIPIMLVYPFLQKFFIKGIVIGSVKG